MKNREDYQEQLEDAVTGLLMHEWIESEGRRALEEYQKAKEEGTLEPVPEESSQRMIAFIHKQFRKKRRQQLCKTMLRVMRYSAAAACVLLTVVSVTAFASSPTFRQDVLSLVTKQTETGTDYSFSDGRNQAMPSEYTETTVQNFTVNWLPDGLAFQKEERTQDTIVDTFSAADGRYLTIRKVTGAATTVSVDTDGAEISQAKIHGNTAQVAEKEDMVTVTWTDTQQVSIYCVTAQGIDTQDVLKTAKQLA
ncbi:DUF4367 domain-containing protein [Butyricicoccus sp.]|uniref:DUF4367 domain-containing protein n=1 Tax=Butyricicoccus sp. TaxID=2049021 RepID=UPI003D7D40AD